jgi:MFS family permease
LIIVHILEESKVTDRQVSSRNNDMEKNGSVPASLAWLVWGLGAAFYFSGFYQRVAPAVMTDALMADFKIGGAGLGNLSAFYFYSYVVMQIPTGILADSWGPRKLLATGSFIAAMGAFLFAFAPSLLLAGLGRLLIGGAVGVAWVALLKLSMHWFPPHRFALVTGLALLWGIGGGVSAGVPLRFLIDHLGWRSVMVFSGAATLLLAAVIWYVVRDDPAEKGYKSFAPRSARSREDSFASVLAGLRDVLKYRNTWLLTIGPSGIVGPVLAFAGLWGVPFLSVRYGLSTTESAAVTSSLLVAWAAGGPALGALTDRVGRRKPLYILGAVIASVGWILALYLPRLPFWVFMALVITVGFASGVVIIGFAFVKESVPPQLSGTVTGVCNMGYMMGPMILQPLMGWVLDQSWKGGVQNGARIYDTGAYHAAFALMVAWSILTIVLICLTKETCCRQMVDDK